CSFLMDVSKYSNRKAIPTPSIRPMTAAIAMFSIGFGATGDGFSFNTAGDKIETLSTLIKSEISLSNTFAVVLAISTASAGSSSCTVTLTTCEFSAVATVILLLSCSTDISRSNWLDTSSNIAGLLMITEYV